MKIDSLNSMLYSGIEYQKLQKADSEGASHSADTKDVSDTASIEPYLEKSLAYDPAQTDAVQQAKKALETGELDTPEAFRRTAETILKLGI